MELNTIFLIAAALLPAIVLCVYVFKKDRVEKEPVGLLLKLLLMGVVSCFPAAFVEGFLFDIIDNGFISFFGSETIPLTAYYLYTAITYFIGVALVEEGFKWLFLVWITKNNKEFNCLFDGMIYAIFVSLGFAAYENILYVVQYGWMNALMRGILSVPGHMFFGVMMGYYYSRWQIFERAANTESSLVRQGYISYNHRSPISFTRDRWMSILVPVFFHGTYDFCCSIGETWATLAFYGFVIFMYVHCFSKLKETSRNDAPTDDYIISLIVRKYPELTERIRAKREAEEINQ